jgi:hypothetical protein
VAPQKIARSLRRHPTLRNIGGTIRALLPTLVVVLGLALLPQLAFAASCTTYSGADTTSVPGFVNMLINNLPYILGAVAIAFLAFAALDNGGLPQVAKNGLYVAAVVMTVASFITFLIAWKPGCFGGA